MTTIARNLVGSLEIQARAVPPQRVRYLGEDKKFSETSEKPLDKTTKVWYNNHVGRGSQEGHRPQCSPTPTETLKKFQKTLDILTEM